jgi:TetR/AcrR family transcriptional repressor of mexJK operon
MVKTAGKKSRLPPPPGFIPPFLLATDKRTTIMRAAITLFLRDGYSNTSMDAITAGAEVSKATVYSYFNSKEELFEVLIQEGSAAFFADFPPLVRHGGEPQAELLAFFEPVLAQIFASGGAWDRLIIAEAVRHPEGAELFNRCAVGRMTGIVAAYLRELDREGWGTIPDAEQFARLLLSMVLMGPLHTLLLAGPQGIDYRQTMQAGIELFLRGIGNTTRATT